MSSTPIIIGGVECRELWREGRPESGRETISQDKITATRVLRCAWSQRLVLARQLRGGATTTGQLQAPASYPDIPECYCSSVEIEGLGVANKSGAQSQVSYTDAILTVHYETPDFKVLANPNGGQLLMRESMDYTAQFITQPNRGFKWLSGKSMPEDAMPGQVMGMSEYSITIFHHPFPNWTNIEAAVGKIHYGVFAPLTRSFPDGTVLFLGVHDDLEFIMDPFGNLTIPAWTVTYKFAYRRRMWNQAYNPDTGIWEGYVTKNGDLTYEPTNLYLVF